MRWIFVLLLTTCTAQADDVCSYDPNEFRCVKFLYNYDADTIKVDIPRVHWLVGKNISVRVRGVDTPELHGKGKCEKEASAKARDRIAGILRAAKQINLVKIGRDKYFRVLADVIADGQSLKDVLLKEGLAYPYDGGTKLKKNWCQVIKEI